MLRAYGFQFLIFINGSVSFESLPRGYEEHIALAVFGQTPRLRTFMQIVLATYTNYVL